MSMKVAIIGAGFGGLATAYFLSKQGVNVVVFESGNKPGGLAVGFKKSAWKWSLEEHYHHIFTTDSYILNLAREVDQKMIFSSPKASTFFEDGTYQVDSPLTLLKFSKLSLFDRLRTGAVIAFLKLNPFWRPLERLTAEKFIKYTMGNVSWNILWRPLFLKKFGVFEKEVNAAWFWARIKKRTMKLGYPAGGFLEFAKKIEKKIVSRGGKIIYKTEVTLIEQEGGKFIIHAKDKKDTFDKVVCTLPAQQFASIVKGLPKEYLNKISGFKGLGTINLVLLLKNNFLDDGSYWLNVNEVSYPFLAVIEHTNFIDKSEYNNSHLLYVANYLLPSHKYFELTKKQLFDLYFPYLKKISSRFSKNDVKEIFVFKSRFTQPVVFQNHSQRVPSFTTALEDLYLCNMQQVYPWDRGTNYAVENAQKVSDLVLKSKQ